ncbi:hypothetical protein I3F60_26265 [Streptomyces sp. MUM 136J]|uniref:hypothetical protein n=1 Tax=Streptomyces sp. MUM 136J TaxID=2791992 RepID=UPI001F04DDE0|nr:hypothetical protein [Streptomyces sp. MUM 136J]MCH0572708.1 hypothetical protein [Streptomyces sp. MUM 136J]
MVLGIDLRRWKATTSRGPGAAGRGTAFAAALLLILAPALASCSDGGDGGSPSSSQTASASPSLPADVAAAEQQIKENWRTFFDPNTSLTDKQAVLENGERMAPVLQAFSGDQRGGQVQATVEKVEFTSAGQATVTYDLTLNGATVLPGASGTAVEQDGTWKVSVSTLCALVQMSGNESASQSPIPGC